MSSLNHSSSSARVAHHVSFRVVCHRADGCESLVRILPTLAQANLVARLTAEKHLAKLRDNRAAIVADAQRPRGLSVQRWEGDAIAGHWERLVPPIGYAIEFFDRAPRRHRKANPHHSDQHGRDGHRTDRLGQRPSDADGLVTGPRSGDLVDAVLLTRRTRKGGWFARLANGSAAGPIIGQPTDPNLMPGQTIRLKLCGIRLETGFAQFAWAEA